MVAVVTPDDLRKLADAATPGPWTKAPDSNAVFANFQRNEYMPGEFINEGDVIVYDEGRPLEADARLIVLAPDLARLCAKLAEALLRTSTYVAFHFDNVNRTQEAEDDLAGANVALSTLSELESVT